MFEFSKKRIYLDYASATPVLSQAMKAVAEAAKVFGNPGAIHAEGVAAAASLKQSRGIIALELAVKSREVIFTSGGTESNNLAILGFARALSRQGLALAATHWVVSAIEHPSVLECFAEVERLGGEVTFVDPDKRGIIMPETVERALRLNTVFVSIQRANHEIGTMQPIRVISRKIRDYEKEHFTQILFHCDLGQAPLFLSPQVHTLGVDIAALDSGKLYGPRGIGAVYLHNRVQLSPVIVGGGQERGLRAGTENVALAAGFAVALKEIGAEREKEVGRIAKLREKLAREFLARIPNTVINGDLTHSLPHILNISIPDISSEYITLALDRRGIAISTKSACREGEESRSHVVEALGGESWRASNTLRFSLGRDTTGRDIEKTAQALTEVLARTPMVSLRSVDKRK